MSSEKKKDKIDLNQRINDLMEKGCVCVMFVIKTETRTRRIALVGGACVRVHATASCQCAGIQLIGEMPVYKCNALSYQLLAGAYFTRAPRLVFTRLFYSKYDG